jgi:hypothetical protein
MARACCRNRQKQIDKLAHKVKTLRAMLRRENEMYNLSEYFSRSEFACKCGCGFDTVDAALLEALKYLRQSMGKPVTITSGCRCPEYNKQIGGSKNSQHTKGRAADIVVEGVPANQVQAYFEGYGIPGLGCYEDFTHIDTRSGDNARWKQ